MSTPAAAWKPYPMQDFLAQAAKAAEELLKKDFVIEVQVAEVPDPYGSDSHPYLMLAVVDDERAEQFLQQCENPRIIPDIDIADIDSETSVVVDIERPESNQEVARAMLTVWVGDWDDDPWFVDATTNTGTLMLGKGFVLFLVSRDWTESVERLDRVLGTEEFDGDNIYYHFSEQAFGHAVQHRFVFDPSTKLFSPIG